MTYSVHPVNQLKASPLISQKLSFFIKVYEFFLQLIDSARDLLDTELTAMAGESYQRAYGAMVSVQMLAELEEVVQYKLVPERQPTIRKMWWDRLQVRSFSHWVSLNSCLKIFWKFTLSMYTNHHVCTKIFTSL